MENSTKVKPCKHEWADLGPGYDGIITVEWCIKCGTAKLFSRYGHSKYKVPINRRKPK